MSKRPYPLKKPLTYDEQVEYLINKHKLSITDTSRAKQILSHVNYYRLSAYGIGLKKKDNTEEYRDDITLETLYRLYQFDSRFKNLIFHLIEQLEIQLRTQISYGFSIKYGAGGYLNSSNFIPKKKKDGSDVYTSIINSFYDGCKRQRNLPFVQHHMKKYGGRFPLWVAVELFTFGKLSSFYSVMKSEDQAAIANLYKTKPNHLRSWILSLIEIRNICAHYGRLYNMPLKQEPYLFKEYRQYGPAQYHGRRAPLKVFPAIFTMKIMLKADSRWDHFYNELVSLMDEYCDVVNISFIGFPPDWKDVLS